MDRVVKTAGGTIQQEQGVKLRHGKSAERESATLSQESPAEKARIWWPFPCPALIENQN